MGTDYLWCEPWRHFLGPCADNSTQDTQRSGSCFCHSTHTCFTVVLLAAEISVLQMIVHSFSQMKWSVLHESVLACSAILLTWIPTQILFGSPNIQYSLQSGSGVKHVTTTSGNTETELNALRKDPTSKANFMSVLLYLQEYNVQETWKVV